MEAKTERDKLQREFENITRTPFFKRETDKSHFQRIQELEKKVDDRERQIRQAKENIVKMD